MTKKQSRKKSRQQEAPNPSPVDRRALEKTTFDISRLLSDHEFGSIDEANQFLRELLDSGSPLDSPPRSRLEEAQDVMYQAWEAVGAQRVKLAQKALAISPDCADAYVLLAEETAKTPQEARQFYEKGVEAGKRALGPQTFQEDVGHFWGLLETRPYMRARAGLAQCLWALGEKQEAVDHFTDMLRLNPGDNQGVRYLLATLLLEVGDDVALQKLLGQYEDEYSANWKYTSALLAFRQEGRSQKANALLTEAITFNRFVPPYLLGKKKLPHRMPAYYSPGDDSEAIDYVVEAIIPWRKTEGALVWLQDLLTARKA